MSVGYLLRVAIDSEKPFLVSQQLLMGFAFARRSRLPTCLSSIPAKEDLL